MTKWIWFPLSVKVFMAMRQGVIVGVTLFLNKSKSNDITIGDMRRFPISRHYKWNCVRISSYQRRHCCNSVIDSWKLQSSELMNWLNDRIRLVSFHRKSATSNKYVLQHNTVLVRSCPRNIILKKAGKTIENEYLFVYYHKILITKSQVCIHVQCLTTEKILCTIGYMWFYSLTII